jgi:hypothetical protein
VTDLTGIELDRLLCVPEQVTDSPSPEKDQRDAAASHAHSIQTYVAQLYGMSHVRGYYRDYPDWIRLGVSQTVAEWVTGKGRTCLHAPTIRKPQPVFTAAWKPGLVVCQPCCHLLQFRHGSVKDRTCDRCGHVVSGKPPDLISAHSIRLGSVTWMYGLCAGCDVPPTGESCGGPHGS